MGKMMTPEEKRAYDKKVGYLTGIIGAIIFIALLILTNVL